MERIRRTDRWRKGHGVCYVCGQPLAAAPRTKPEEEDIVDPLERVLTEECPVRLSLMRFNMLGEYHEAHLVDEYTFLERKSGEDKSFKLAFRQNFAALIRPLNPEAFDRFKAQVMNASPLYDEALGTIARAAEGRTIPACDRCNRGMYRLYEHTLTVFRCFPVTAHCDSAALEARSVTGNKARKVVQQIALFFRYDGAHWHAKTSDQVLQDAALWRCIAFVHSWGNAPSGSGIRLRLIAIFYASFYIYIHSSSMRNLSFEDWHTHVWRPFYLTTFGAHPCFFRVDQTTAAYRLDVSRGKNGAECMRTVVGILRGVGEHSLMDWEHALAAPQLGVGVFLDDDEDDDDRGMHRHRENANPTITRQMRAVTRAVKDEATLVRFLSEKKGVAYGVDRLLYFFCSNLAERREDSTTQTRLARLKQCLCAACSETHRAS